LKIRVLEYYERKAGFDSWVIAFIYRNESARAIILSEDGTLTDIDITNIKIETKIWEVMI